ncbi:4-(cytidine 5'-diphospho)-2-C-methyl-D-erythritol kinase [Anaerolentibacter hominis]|uniref:4-(cytidine 5'-diphospho)-2-C-methyl-D-erythritol kinase n=1 Tax=Anaerolentibacter hominis TaxID=3079009 RepID=UPI0031B8B032
MNSISLQALAKINLGLDVLGKREDGYHELRMIMQTIRLADQVYLKKTKAPGIHFKTNLPYLPCDERNIAWQAASMIMKEFSIEEGIFISLSKKIPVAAGLAGGSSDAAAVLVGMNRLFHLDLPKKELMQRGVQLGADVPYCILRGTALSEGIGEILTPLPPVPDCCVVILKPDFSVSTRYVYSHLRVGPDTRHPDIDGMLQDIADGSINGIATKLGNVLEEVTIPVHPEIAQIKQTMLDCGALGALMSGSGPTVFGLYSSFETGRKACGQLRRIYPSAFTFYTSFYNVRRKSNDEKRYTDSNE